LPEKSPIDKDRLYEKCLERVKFSLKGKTLAESLKAACKILKEGIPYYFWVGFYCPGEKNTLNLGSSEGPPACARVMLWRCLTVMSMELRGGRERLERTAKILALRVGWTHALRV
jgi:putative methionine-R-sulfoxide reductase with GAF domain